MKAAVRDRYGPPDVVEVRDVDRPTPTQDQVLVRVHAASVNRADLDGLYPRWQLTRLFFGLRKPRTPRLGLDVAGVVESVGPAVTRFKSGDRVFADLFAFGMGAFAEYACAREKAFLPIPTSMSFEDAATLPHSAVLAIQGLRHGDRTVGSGDKLLVVGASGNVGPFVVQIAKSRGADVTGVCRTGKMDFVRSLGADRVIDYTKVDYTRTGEPYDWIVDVDAYHGILRWRDALKPKGVYVAMGGPGSWILQALLVGPITALATGKRMGLLLGWKPFKREDVETLEELIAAGKVKPAIDRRYPMSQIVDALKWVDEGHARGKVVITV
ncbi:MAG: NAD(P)-dependent alcohol dehydrogenase [Chloroflexota bacterium]|nr:NAD(P)-dependent alcohol dehydrogenase [Chloroflexota bacterium]